MHQVHIVERAFQMADDPDYASVQEICQGLSKERYGQAALAHLDGTEIRRQLRSRIASRLGQAA